MVFTRGSVLSSTDMYSAEDENSNPNKRKNLIEGAVGAVSLSVKREDKVGAGEEMQMSRTRRSSQRFATFNNYEEALTTQETSLPTRSLQTRKFVSLVDNNNNYNEEVATQEDPKRSRRSRKSLSLDDNNNNYYEEALTTQENTTTLTRVTRSRAAQEERYSEAQDVDENGDEVENDKTSQPLTKGKGSEVFNRDNCGKYWQSTFFEEKDQMNGNGGEEKKYSFRNHESTRRVVYEIESQTNYRSRPSKSELLDNHYNNRRIGGSENRRRHRNRDHNDDADLRSRDVDRDSMYTSRSSKRYRNDRRHYDSSSESDSDGNGDGESDNEDYGFLESKKSRGRRNKNEERGFAKYEKERWDNELSSIVPLNGVSRRDSTNSFVKNRSHPERGAGGGRTKGKVGHGVNDKFDGRDLARADANPLEIDTNLSWDDVGGMTDKVNMLKEMVMLPLLYPEYFERFQVTPPRGVLFYGPPGTGKTLIARVLAATCSQDGRQVAFFMRKGADCLSKWVGEAERQLRLLFEQAKRYQPSIIFFDELDGLAPVRSSKQDQIHSSIVSTLLALMDGLDSRGQVVVIGATNRPDAIDPALRRPGRFDKEVAFTLPDQSTRRSIIDVHTKNWNPALSIPFRNLLARKTVGYCGADIKALCSEASLCALRRRYPQIYTSQRKLQIKAEEIMVLQRDFERAMQIIVPAAHRAAITYAAPLPEMLEKLLQEDLKEILENLRMQGITNDLKINPGHRKGVMTKSFDESHIETEKQMQLMADNNIDVIEDESVEIEAVYGIINKDFCEKCRRDAEATDPDKDGDLVCCDFCPNTYHFNCISKRIPLPILESDDEWQCEICYRDDKKKSQVVTSESSSYLDKRFKKSNAKLYNSDWTTNYFVHRPALLITAQDKDLGQNYLARAVLHELECLPVFSLDLSNLLGDPMFMSPEQALISKVTEAKKNAPAILYLPSLDAWWENASPTMQSTLHMSLEGIIPSLPLVVLATCTGSPQEPSFLPRNTPSFFQRLFVDKYHLVDTLRWNYEDFMDPLLEEIERLQETYNSLSLMGWKEREAAINKRKKQITEILPVAPFIRQETIDTENVKDPEVEARKQEQEEHYKRELRICLRAIIYELRKDKKYSYFWYEVDPEDVPDYYEIIQEPMDLETMRTKVNNAEYDTLTAFINDIELILRNAKEYNPGGLKDAKGRVIVSAAYNMLDNVKSMAHRFKHRIGYELFRRLETIAEEKVKTGSDDIVSSEEWTNTANAKNRTSSRSATELKNSKIPKDITHWDGNVDNSNGREGNRKSRRYSGDEPLLMLGSSSNKLKIQGEENEAEDELPIAKRQRKQLHGDSRKETSEGINNLTNAKTDKEMNLNTDEGYISQFVGDVLDNIVTKICRKTEEKTDRVDAAPMKTRSNEDKNQLIADQMKSTSCYVEENSEISGFQKPTSPDRNTEIFVAEIFFPGWKDSIMSILRSFDCPLSVDDFIRLNLECRKVIKEYDTFLQMRKRLKFSSQARYASTPSFVFDVVNRLKGVIFESLFSVREKRN